MLVTLAALDELSRTGDTSPGSYDQALVLGRGYLSQVQAEFSSEAFAVTQEEAKTLALDQIVAEFLASPPLFSDPARGT